MGETWCSETERMLSENDDSECEYHCRQIKSAALEVDTLQSIIIGKSLNPKKYRKVLRILLVVNWKGYFAEC